MVMGAECRKYQVGEERERRKKKREGSKRAELNDPDGQEVSKVGLLVKKSPVNV